MNETQLFYDSYLVHHGVKGMKWGVRRYQNKDGSLTPAGKKRVQEAGSLYFPAYDRKRRKWKGTVTNRFAVRPAVPNTDLNDAVMKEYDRLMKDKKTLKKAGYIFTDEPDSDIREHNADIVLNLMDQTKVVKQARVEATKRFVDKYADATIADLKLANTEKTKAFVEEHLLSSDKTYMRELMELEELERMGL